MSERKSWDVQRKPGRAAPPAQASSARPVERGPVRSSPRPATRPTPRTRPVEPARTRKAQQSEPVRARPSPRRAPLPTGTLRERRNRKRKTARYIFLAILLLIAAAFLYGVWRPAFRITSVQASGPGADRTKQAVLSNLSGTYLYLIPRNSVFFYPTDILRAAILNAVPDAAAVSMNRTSFSSLAVRTISREKSFIWCGTSIDLPNADGACYEADVEGYIFAQSSDVVTAPAMASTTASSTASVPTAHGQIRVYAPLTKQLAEGQSPLRAHIVSAPYIANALRFVDAVRTLGASVNALSIRSDEADLWLSGNTRITYVLGREKEAADVAASALPTLNLKNGSIQYIDLRFAGKAYVKKYGE